jgi:hypothetical protein
MKNLCYVLFALLFLWPLVHSALADAPLATLVANGRAEYRFEYRGDRTPIEIALDTQGVSGVDLSVYTPAQLETAKGGGELKPVGRGTPGGGHDSFWVGQFNAPGVYEAVLENHTPGPVLYQLSIAGKSVSAVAQILPDAPPAGASFAGRNILSVSLPPGAGPASLAIAVPAAPATCTHSYQIPPVISQSLKLCPGELYPPLHLIGNNLALYSDEGHGAIVAAGGRQFAVTVEGAHNLVEGVTIQASPDAADLGAWLCQYDECIFPTVPRQTILNGGIRYGGGILLRGSYSTIHAVAVHGGTIGVATVGGFGNYVLDNQLSGLNGWGSFNVGAASSYFVGNVLNRENHGCTTPDGLKFKHGCETAGWVCLGCRGNVIARNHCESSANCFYMSGDRGQASDDNKLVANYCAGATDNCFEITFSQGNILQDNITTADPNSGGACNYPFWIGGSTIYLNNNLWQCAVSGEEALARAAASTPVQTLAIWGGGPAPAGGTAATSSTTGSAPGPRRPPGHGAIE